MCATKQTFLQQAPFEFSAEMIQVCRNRLRRQELTKEYEPVDEAWGALPELLEQSIAEKTEIFSTNH